jgi:tRNA(Arg) A34 adenosine deaminase TadA
VTRHEEALARIVTIVGKLTNDENVSETEKNNVKAEMNRLQEKWNNTQNNVNLNYLRYVSFSPCFLCASDAAHVIYLYFSLYIFQYYRSFDGIGSERKSNA